MFQYVSILKWSFDLDDLGYPHDFGNPPVVPAREGGSLDFHEIAVAQLHQLRIAITGILRRSKWRTVELWKPHCHIVYEPIVNGKSLSKLLNKGFGIQDFETTPYEPMAVGYLFFRFAGKIHDSFHIRFCNGHQCFG